MNAELANVTPLPSPGPSSGIATIARRQDEAGVGLTIVFGDRELLARRAVSCLVEPIVDDRVWVVSEGGEYFVTAVLTREADADVELRATTGALRLRGEKGVEIESPQLVQVTADTLRVVAKTSEVGFGKLRAYASEVVATLARVTRIGEVLELYVDRVIQRSRQSVRTIEDLDHTVARNVDVRAQESMQLSAKDALVNGERLVKMNADQIHLG